MKEGLLILLLILALGMNTLLPAITGTSQTATPPIDREVSFTVAVVFVGYDERCVNVPEITKNLKTTYDKEIILPGEEPNTTSKVKYSLSFDLLISNRSYTQALNNFVSRQSVESLTSGLDIDALMEQRKTGRRMRAFFPQHGISVDAVALEDWLQEYPCKAMPVPGYTIYMLNLSHLDSHNGSTVHWFDPGIRDVDSGQTVNWFRLEWDNYLNLPVYPAYAGWGNASRIFFLDPSAHQWYLKWAAVWWEGRTKDPPYGHDFTGLKEFARSRNILSPLGRTELAHYLAGWIDQLVDGLVRRDEGVSRFYSDALVDVLIVNGAKSKEIVNQDLAWITREEILSPIMNDIAPFMKWRFNVTIRDMDSYPSLKRAVFENSTYEDGRLRVLGADTWSFLDREATSIFNLGAADFVIPCPVIVMNDTSMMAEGPAGIGEFTGLGGDRKVLVMKELSRYYFPGNQTRKSGLTSVLVHELGHNLGLNHTFPPYCTDFTGDVMGYLSHSSHFTEFMKDSFQRNTFDSIYLQIKRNATKIQDAEKRSIVQALMDEALLLYNKMSYVDAVQKLKEATRIAQSNQSVVAKTTLTITQFQTHVTEMTLTHTVTETATTTTTHEVEPLQKMLPLYALSLVVALTLIIIWIAGRRGTKRVLAGDERPMD